MRRNILVAPAVALAIVALAAFLHLSPWRYAWDGRTLTRFHRHQDSIQVLESGAWREVVR